MCYVVDLHVANLYTLLFIKQLLYSCAVFCKYVLSCYGTCINMYFHATVHV